MPVHNVTTAHYVEQDRLMFYEIKLRTSNSTATYLLMFSAPKCESVRVPPHHLQDSTPELPK